MFLNTLTKALSGASVADDDANNVVVAFAFADHLAFTGLNQVVALRCAVTAGQLQSTSATFKSERTRIQPAVAFDHGDSRFVMAWREQNFATTLATMALMPGATAWTGKVLLLGSPNHVAPAVASSPEYNEAVIWYGYEQGGGMTT